MLRLLRLKVKNCRGILDGPDLTFQKGGLLLCGGNGTGKSSYVDAIEKILTGHCASLEGEQGLSWKQQGTHVRSTTPPDVQIIFKGDDSREHTLRIEDSPADLSRELQALLLAAQRQSFILRRRTMLRFIDAKGRDRYDALEGFLNVNRYADFEVQLKEQVTELDRSIRSLESEKDQITQSLQQQSRLPQGSAFSIGACFAAVSQLLNAAGCQPVSHLSEAKARLGEVEAQLRPYGNVDELHSIQSLLDGLDALPTYAEIALTGEVYSACIRERNRAEEGLTGHFYPEVLRQGVAWIQNDQRDRCPLCNSSIDLESVDRHVASQLEQNHQVSEARDRLTTTHQAFRAALGGWINGIQRIQQRWLAVMDSPLPPEIVESVASVRDLYQAHREVHAQSCVSSDLRMLGSANLDAQCTALRTLLNAKKAGYPDAEAFARLTAARAAVMGLTVLLPKLEGCEERTVRLQHSLRQSKTVVRLAERARKDVVQRVLDAISGLADGYYQQVHPGESIGEVVLRMTDRGSSSIAVDSNFYGKKCDPRGHYSEGHVDSLGLCLFLAIRRLHHKQSKDLAILVLDDVLHSVDGDHRRATADLIFKEFGDHQIIITTHDPLWFEHLKAAQRSVSGTARCTQLKISEWTIDRGPVWGDHLSDYEWLIGSEGVGGRPADRVVKAGRLLEELLQNVCDSLAVSVPFRIRGDYTIEPLWAAFRNHVKRSKGFLAVANDDLDAIERLRAYRNWAGAHWNEWAGLLTDQEARQFAEAVVKLRRVLYCEDCGQFVRRVADLDGVWACRGEHMRYDKG